MRGLFEIPFAEIAFSETTPRGGWGGRSVTLIAPDLDVHSLVSVDPGLIRISADYGWMRADDAVNGRVVGDRLFDLSREITLARARIWFNEGRYYGLFRNAGLGEFANLGSWRIDLQRQVEERRRLGGSLPPGNERWAQIGEAHTTKSGAWPIVNLSPFDGAVVATTLSNDGQPIAVLLNNLSVDLSRHGPSPNDARNVVYSTGHHEPLRGGITGWRIAGLSDLPAFAFICCVRAPPDNVILLAADADGITVRAESTPDGYGFTGWLPISDGRTAPGGWVTGDHVAPGRLTDPEQVLTDTHIQRRAIVKIPILACGGSFLRLAFQAVRAFLASRAARTDWTSSLQIRAETLSLQIGNQMETPGKTGRVLLAAKRLLVAMWQSYHSIPTPLLCSWRVQMKMFIVLSGRPRRPLGTHGLRSLLLGSNSLLEPQFRLFRRRLAWY